MSCKTHKYVLKLVKKSNAIEKPQMRRDINRQQHDCATCNKSFASKTSLCEHTEFIHNKDQSMKFMCGFCGLHCDSKSDLVKHIVNCESFEYLSIVSDDTIHSSCSSTIEQMTTRNDTIKPFVCDVCNHGFNQKGNMDKHRLKIHGISLPSTRQTRHRLRISVTVSRYESKELDSKRRARFAIFDNVTHKYLNSEDGKQILLSKSECKKYVDNCNIIEGLLNAIKTKHAKVTKEWTTPKEALLSFMDDRPNQKDMIVSIVEQHIDI